MQRVVHIQDMAPCGPKGCVMTTEGNAACEAKCNATKGCAGYVFAPKTCSGQSGPICWLKSVMKDASPVSMWWLAPVTRSCEGTWG